MNSMATVSRMPVPVRRTDSDVSPKTIIPPQDSTPRDAKVDYFPDSNTVDGSNTSVRASDDDSSAHKSSISFAPDPRPDRSSSRESDQNQTQNQDLMVQRKSSTGSVSFRRMTNPKLPQGIPQQMSNSRIRASSPDHKRSRCFMVGVDEHAYSDYALQWLLEELVDDGDEVVCVRVVEKELRYSNREYREDAEKVMRGILDRNGNNRAINIVLEYAVGKLHTTFQVLIQMYQPAMLIVGTRGRTLGGLQGLVNTRNSFSKYCLQYSPVPVVVVRPTEKRVKKKSKRANDSARQTYVSMLAANSGKHEADSEASSTYELEVQNSPDEEAHQVARALGLPASFDPTIKPFNHSQALNVKPQGPATVSASNEAPEDRRLVKDDASAAGESDDEDDGESDDDSGEFEVVSGQQALDQEKLKQLHKMEVGEAAALKMKVNEDLDEEDDTPSAQKDNNGIEQIDGFQDYPNRPADSHRLQDIDSHEHSPEAGRDAMELETMSRVTKDDNDVEDQAREESFAGDTGTTNGSRENPQNQRPNPELPAEDQRSSVDLEAQDQLGREPRDGRGGGRDNDNYANGNADNGLNDACEIPPRPVTLASSISALPFLFICISTSILVVRHVFPRLSTDADSRDGEDHVLPTHAPACLRQVHAEHGAKSWRRRGAAWTFGLTVGLAATLGALIMDEIIEVVNADSRNLALRITVPSLLFLLVVLVPWLECRSVVTSAGWSFQRTAKGKLPRFAWGLHAALFMGWLFAFWSVGQAVPEGAMRRMSNGSGSLSDMLTRGCLERIGVVGISLMALLSGFAAVSSPWHAFMDLTARRKRPVTDTDVARKQAGWDTANEMLLTKRHRLQFLERKTSAAQTGAFAKGSGLVGKVMGSLRGATGDEAEMRSLRLEIAGLETMEANLASGVSLLKSHRAATVRASTPLGRLFLVPSQLFSLYCLYRIGATTITTIRRAYSPTSTFANTDPINRFLSILARHWDPKLDQLAWARLISFALSGVILVASANSVVQTFHLFAKWTPGLLRQAQANLALVVGQIAATYVISAALLLRSQLPSALGSAVGSVLRGALSPAFVDGWFEGWFLVGSLVTAIGIWVGRKLGGEDEWDEYGMEEVGAKMS
ncbi:hypothetical protein FPSE5266_08691 [Fusarium pseudograminearum]|nr:hypothetical protein FPSE5266_08691 [Fusarium pseudograminearum]